MSFGLAKPSVFTKTINKNFAPKLFFVKHSLPRFSPSFLSSFVLQKCLLRSKNFELRPLLNFQRCYSSSSNDSTREKLEELGNMFAEARDDLETAKENAETIYFHEELDVAKQSVAKTLEYYQKLLKELKEDEAARLKREQDPKMRQLKLELELMMEH
eukprot:TRINITY_DN4541_c0_g1_i1.p1 TRINITY_DN4541_c0_g1~~TRINITY_DN4541_c0_g1_i1.p1  ORF type:complete len:171 (-),score=47.17 TRINITY_DN4541_c0_g1_i1:26-499(-)